MSINMNGVPQTAKIAPVTWAALLGGCAMWGSGMAVVKIALQNYDPVFLVGARMIMAFVVFTPFILWRFRPIRIRKKDIPLLTLLILCDPVGFFTFEALAMQHTSAAQASMMWAMAPLLNTVAACLILREKTNLPTVIGFIVAMAGVIMLTTTSGESEHASNPVLGNFLEFLSLCGAAGFLVILRFLKGRYPAMLVVWIQCLGASIFFLPLMFFMDGTMPTEFPVGPTIALIYLGVCVSFGAQCFSAYAVARIPIPRTAAFGNLIPVIGVLCGLILLGESLLPIQWVACAIVLGAVIASQKFAPKQPEDKPQEITAADVDVQDGADAAANDVK